MQRVHSIFNHPVAYKTTVLYFTLTSCYNKDELIFARLLFHCRIFLWSSYIEYGMVKYSQIHLTRHKNTEFVG